VLEQSGAPGGGSRTEETVPGFRFDTHSVAHNILNMTAIPRELDLAGAGLEYVEMDPFAVAVFADGRRVRFHRDVGRTLDSIAAVDGREAEAYAGFLRDAAPLVEVLTFGLDPSARRARSSVRPVGRLLRRRGPRAVAADLLRPYGALLEARLASDLTRGPVAAFAAHAGASPDAAGGAVAALWQAAYHRFGQWHARGGSGALAAALVRRLRASGGEVRCDAPVARIETTPAGRVRGVRLEDGERLEADAVVTALDPRVALLELLDPPLGGRAGADLRAAHAGNAVQALVHVAADLPAYTGLRPGDHHGLQSYVDGLGALRTSFAHADAGLLPPAPAAAYAFTTSALDPALGEHTVYLACPAAPYRVRGGWTEEAARRLADDLVDQVERRAPGFRATIRGVHVRTPDVMARELRWPGAHPLHLDVTPDQLSVLRPTPALASHRTPVPGLYVTGAGTAPVGGIAGAPGRAAARALLADR